MTWFSEEAYSICMKWWYALDSHTGDRAALRRASIPDETYFFAPYTHELLQNLQRAQITQEDHVVGIVAMSLAQIVKHTDERLGHTLGRQISAERFLTLVREESPEEACRKLRRLLPIVNNTVSVSLTAAIMATWSTKTRKHLSIDFYDRYKPKK